MSATFNPPGKLTYAINGVWLQWFDLVSRSQTAFTWWKRSGYARLGLTSLTPAGNIVFREDDGKKRHCVFWSCHFRSLTSRAVFLCSSIAEAGDSFARCPLHKGTKSVSRLLFLWLPCITGEYLNSGSNYDVYLAMDLAKGHLHLTLFSSLGGNPAISCNHLHTYLIRKHFTHDAVL